MRKYRGVAMKKKFIEPEFTVIYFSEEVVLTSNYGDDNVDGWIWGDEL